ncbi:hypothetical protein RB213_003458 [Colletotrichum asianum]
MTDVTVTEKLTGQLGVFVYLFEICDTSDGPQGKHMLSSAAAGPSGAAGRQPPTLPFIQSE